MNNMKHNSLFTGASRIQLKDGSVLEEKNPHILKSIIHKQLNTHKNKFALRKRKNRVFTSRGKASKPAKPVLALPAPKEPTFAEVMATEGTVRYH